MANVNHVVSAVNAMTVNNVFRAAPFLRAYHRLSDELRGHADKMVETITDKDSSQDDITLACLTLQEILFGKIV